MRRILALMVGGTLAVSMAVVPAAATPTAPQENVVHVANLPGTTGGDVAVEGDTLYMGNYGIGMTIYDVSNPASPVQIGEYRPGRAVADATVSAAHFEERKIAVLGGTSRAPGTQTTDWLDVTDPANPVLLASLTGGTEGESHNADIVDERKLYLPSGGGFRIFDISPLLTDDPQKPATVFTGNLHALWNQSPFKPAEESAGPTFTHIHDIQVYTDYSVLLPEAEWVDQDGDGTPDPTRALKDIALIAEGGSYELGAEADNGGVYVVDITDPANPVVMERWRHPANRGQSDDQMIRYYHEVRFLDADPHVMLVTDEDLHTGTCNDGGVAAVRISEDLTETEYLSEWLIPENTTAGLCSAHVFDSNGPYMFMGSYNAGLQVVDWSDPANPVQAGEYITEGANSWGALYHEGYVYVGDFGGRGLDVFQFIPEPDGKAFLKAGNPATAVVGGVSELTAGCDPEADTQIDGFLLEVPESMSSGEHTLRLWGSSEAPYDLDIWYYDEGCNLMNTTAIESGDPVLEGARWAWIDMFVGGPQWVYAKFDA